MRKDEEGFGGCGHTWYLLKSKRNGTLYLGVTSDIVKRVWEHKNGLVEGFTRKYGIKKFTKTLCRHEGENAC